MKSAEDKKLEALLAEIELPDGAYDKAVARYEDLGAWLNRDGSTVKAYNPHISPQGSFALGTAIYPLNRNEHYDLDLTCKMQSAVSRTSHSQFQVKEMVRRELDLYRTARNIQEALEEKRRCWRLLYKDSPGFHLDTVPGIPTEGVRRTLLEQQMRAQGVPVHLTPDLAADAIWITDNKSPNYRAISPDWLSSNPAGYVRWFQSRLTSFPLLAEAQAKVDDMPVYRRKTPLQQVIQLLKRHRDVMFEPLPDSKPISVIITTLAARNYRATEGLAESMQTVLRALDEFQRSDSNEVLNPVNPEENFADKWTMAEYEKHRLKQNFKDWVEQAKADFARCAGAASATRLAEAAAVSLRVAPSSERLALAFGSAALSAAPAVHTPTRVEIQQQPPRPWQKV